MSRKKSAGESNGKQTDLYLLGIGIGGPKAMTIETRDVIKSARVVFDMSDKPHMMKGLNSNRIFLDDTYWSGRPFEEVYQELIQIVLAEVDKGPGVALVSYGHPLVFDSVNYELRDRAKRRGKTVRVMAGISCLDTIFIDVEYDIVNGIQIFEANDLVDARLSMNPNIASLVLQVGYYGIDNTDVDFGFEANHFNPLIKHLAKFYGEEHMVTLVHSDDGDGAELIRTRLKNLDKIRNRILTSMTMFVPAAE